MAYLNYFFFLWLNWDLKIALRILREEIRGEKKYNLTTTGQNDLSHLKYAGPDTGHATIYMPASYGLLETAFTKITPSSYRHFIDIGCGKGRVICVAAHFGFKKISGIEFSTRLIKDAEKNILKTKSQIPEADLQVILEDAAFYLVPDDADCFFLFNPFDEVVLKSLLTNIDLSLGRASRPVTIIYLNSLYKSLLKAFGYTEVHHHEEMQYLQFAIYIKNALPEKGT